MDTGKPITIQGKHLQSGRFPTICTPLVGRNHELVVTEFAVVLPKQADLPGWRVDSFAAIDNTPVVLALATAIHSAAKQKKVVSPSSLVKTNV
jgi:3-dehydroquinate dehydratase-1